METKVMITPERMESYRQELLRRERSDGTAERYLHALEVLAGYLGGRCAEAETLLAWKGAITEQYAVSTVNAMIVAVNGFLAFCGAPELKLQGLRCQQNIFRDTELTAADYRALLVQAQRQDRQTAVLLRTMACTGVRVSELKFLTVESVKRGEAVIRLKGKVRRILLGKNLCRELMTFARRAGIESGAIFRSGRGKALDRRRVWEKLKRLCAGAGVAAEKVHPHALRHFFARMFYGLTQDIVKLADILGHSSVNTTRIYTAESPREHRLLLDKVAEAIHAKKPPRKGGLSALGQNLYFVRLHSQ